MNIVIKTTSALLLVGSLAVPFLGFGCNGAIVDCARICERYSECVAEIDVTECVDLCEDRVDASAQNETDADVCEECLDGTDACNGVPECFENSSCGSVVVPTAD